MTVIASTTSNTFTRTRLTWFSYSCIGLYAYLINLLGPIIPFLRGELGFSYTVSSLHTSAFAVGMMIAGATGDQVAHRFGRRRTFWLGAAGLAVGSLFLTIGWHPALTIAATFFMGTIGTLVMVSINASLADQYGEQRTIAFAESNVVAGIYTVAAPLMVGMASYRMLGWRSSLIIAIGYIILLYWGNQSIELAGLPLPRSAPATTQLSRLPTGYWRYWFVIMAGVAAEFCIVSWASTFLEVSVGFTRENAALILSLFFLAMLLGRWLGTMIVRWIAASQLLLMSIGLNAGGFLLHWLSPVPLFSVTGLFLAGLGVANLFPLALGLAVGSVPEQTTTASARIVVASGSAILTLPLLLGGLADWVGLWLAYGIVLPLLLIAAGLVVSAQEK